MFLNLHGGEIIILIIAAMVILGPRRLPEYAAKLAQGVRYLRDLAEGAKGQIKDELGPGFADVDWRQLDPRQYDPRRIVREALTSPSPGPGGASATAGGSGTGGAASTDQPGLRSTSSGLAGRALVYDPTLPTPYDVEAT